MYLVFIIIGGLIFQYNLYYYLHFQYKLFLILQFFSQTFFS